LLAANGRADVVSVDVDPYSLKRLRLKNSRVNIIQADARKLPLIDEVFDVVFMIEVLDYIPELQTALAECKRTLRTNAAGFLSFGNKSSAKAKFRALRGKSYCHSYSEVMQCLSAVGFNVKKKMGYSWLPLGRTSQSPLVPILAFLEKALGLRKFVRFSPWVIIQVSKPQ
jgi:ubiquinone/menaquinone biosynthesis C-methylase UbiE